jgi:hypothetical protein
MKNKMPQAAPTTLNLSMITQMVKVAIEAMLLIDDKRKFVVKLKKLLTLMQAAILTIQTLIEEAK